MYNDIGSKLFFTNKQARNLLFGLASDCFGDDNISVHFVHSSDDALFLSKIYGLPLSSYSCGTGHTFSEFDEVLCVCIGDAELYSAPDMSDVNSELFVKTLVAIYHERAHVDQVLMCLHQDSPTAKCVGLSYFSAYVYPEYHDLTYLQQADEIQAEYYGVLCGYKFLLDLTQDRKLSNDLICQYVNDRYAENISFLDKSDYTDVETILNDFHTVFRKACYEHKDFQFDGSNMIESDRRSLENMQSEPNGNIQNSIAVKRLQVHLYKQGKDSHDWTNYKKFMSLPAVKALDLNADKFTTKLRYMFSKQPYGRDVKSSSVNIDVMDLEKEIFDYADQISVSDDQIDDEYI